MKTDKKITAVLLELCEQAIARVGDDLDPATAPKELLALVRARVQAKTSEASCPAGNRRPCPVNRESPFQRAMAEARRRYLLHHLDAHRWNVIDTAKAIGISRTYLTALIRHLGLRMPLEGRT